MDDGGHTARCAKKNDSVRFASPTAPRRSARACVSKAGGAKRLFPLAKNQSKLGLTYLRRGRWHGDKWFEEIENVWGVESREKVWCTAKGREVRGRPLVCAQAAHARKHGAAARGRRTTKAKRKAFVLEIEGTCAKAFDSKWHGRTQEIQTYVITVLHRQRHEEKHGEVKTHCHSEAPCLTPPPPARRRCRRCRCCHRRRCCRHHHRRRSHHHCFRRSRPPRCTTRRR